MNPYAYAGGLLLTSLVVLAVACSGTFREEFSRRVTSVRNRLSVRAPLAACIVGGEHTEGHRCRVVRARPSDRGPRTNRVIFQEGGQVVRRFDEQVQLLDFQLRASANTGRGQVSRGATW
jgi:hypothetical protein